MPRNREAVFEAAKRLEYEPSLAAQNLSRGISRGVGVLVQDMGDAYWAEVLRGVEEGLIGSPFYPVFASSHWRLGEDLESLGFLLAHQVCAMIVIAAWVPAERLREIAERMPLIVVHRHVEGLRCICLDNVVAAQLATAHLIGLGHRALAHITGPAQNPEAGERRQGFVRALRAVGREPVLELTVAGDFSIASGRAALNTLLERGVNFTAVFADNDQMAYGARSALFEAGLRVPEDVSLVGLDDLPYSAYATPPLTTVHQPVFDMGLAAGKGVQTLLGGGSFTPPQLKAELIVRRSTGPSPPEANWDRAISGGA